jgi:ABC-type phosphate transport system substrate-binding protein
MKKIRIQAIERLIDRIGEMEAVKFAFETIDFVYSNRNLDEVNLDKPEIVMIHDKEYTRGFLSK